MDNKETIEEPLDPTMFGITQICQPTNLRTTDNPKKTSWSKPPWPKLTQRETPTQHSEPKKPHWNPNRRPGTQTQTLTQTQI